MTTPINKYEQCVKDGKLQDDEAQRHVIARLQSLYNELAEKPDFFKKILPFYSLPPRSLYIWGDVGRGKSLLMDMFFAAAPIKQKQRIHFYAFMQQVHAKSHYWRQEIEKTKSNKPLLSLVAKDIARHFGRLICLDELQVTDVADAMILNGLFSSLLSEGVSFVITSNRPPEELYLGGLQREKFLDFVQLMYERMEVVELSSPQDYRMQQIRAMQTVYMWPLSEANSKALNDSFVTLSHNTPSQSVTLEIQGRKLPISESYGGLAKFNFAELCEKPLGAADYLAIASRFHTIFLSNIPKLTQDKRNEAKRFIALIDTLYDHRIKLICTAAVPPDELYTEGTSTFEFNRTISRLVEMQSGQYLSSPHIV
jgi:cell division protein ZapE